jgi:quercetin dioxygenase-like cupin family protein
MMRKSMLAWTTVLIAAGVIGIGILPLAAQEAPPPIAGEILTPRSVFPDDVSMKIKIKTDDGKTAVKVNDPSRTVTGRFTVQPGAQFPWHTHAGPVLVNVVEGTLVYVETDCGEHAYPAGTAFIDPGHGHVHTAFNPTAGETVFVATFFEAPPEPNPTLILADPPACAA